MSDQQKNDFLYACEEGNREGVERLLAAGFDPLTMLDVDKYKVPGLWVAAWNNQAHLVQVLATYSIDVTANNGETALLAAAFKGFTDIAKFLVCTGANVNLARDDGHTALHWAARNGHLDLVKLLVLSGARTDVIATKYGEEMTVQKWAEKNNHTDVVQWLVNESGTIHHQLPGSIVSKQTMSEEIGQPTGHLMISYCWAQQPQVLNLIQTLREHGCRNIWVDVEQMEGSVLAAMARAVEQASVVVVCLSDAYQRSDNCQLEIEYAMQKKKQIVPVLMESKLHLTGVVGLALGAKLYYPYYDITDTTAKNNIANAVQKVEQDLFTTKNESKNRVNSVVLNKTSSDEGKVLSVSSFSVEELTGYLEREVGLSVDAMAVFRDKNIDGCCLRGLWVNRDN